MTPDATEAQIACEPTGDRDGWVIMSAPNPDHAASCAQLRNRIALNILLDERTISALALAAAVLRKQDDPSAGELEHAIRTHRIGILKQRAVLGAAGVDV